MMERLRLDQQELFLNLRCVLQFSYKMYGFLGFFKKSSQPVNPPHNGLSLQNVRHFLVIFSYHHQKLKKVLEIFWQEFEPRCNFKSRRSTNHFQSDCLSKTTSLET